MKNLLIITLFFFCVSNVQSLSYSANVLNPKPIPPFQIPPKDKNLKTIECLVYGDAGTGSYSQRLTASLMADNAKSNPIDFAISLGDNFYNSGVKSIQDPQWQTKFFNIYNQPSLNVPFYMLLGNHDYRWNPQAQVNYPHPRWKMPARYYSFNQALNNKQYVQFIALDTTPIDLRQQGIENQIDWLEKQLSTSQATWKIVMGHHPLYSGGGHGTNKKMINALEPLLSKYKVDLYMAGHDHDQQLLKVKGLYYLINGNAAGSRNVRWLPESIYAATNLGFSRLRISKNNLVIHFYNHVGQLTYAHTLKK